MRISTGIFQIAHIPKVQVLFCTFIPAGSASSPGAGGFLVRSFLFYDLMIHRHPDPLNFCPNIPGSQFR